jgi:hypothetical protein
LDAVAGFDVWSEAEGGVSDLDRGQENHEVFRGDLAVQELGVV